MVGATGNDDAMLVIGFHPLQGFFALFRDVGAGTFHLLPAGLCRIDDFLCGQFLEFRNERIGGCLQVSKGHKGVAEGDLSLRDFLDIILDVFRVRGDDRAVIMIGGSLDFPALVEQSGIEDKVYLLFDQPLHMSVRNLGGIAFRLTGNGFNAEFVDLSGGLGRQDDTVSQFGKKSEPERIVFVKIQDPWNADRSPLRHFHAQRLIAEDAVVLVPEEIGRIGIDLRPSQSSFATVSGNILSATGKAIDRQPAAVGATFAGRHTGGILQRIDLINRQHRGRKSFLFMKALAGNEGGTEGTHNAGNVRSDRLTVGDFFKGAKHRIVVKGTALYHDVFAKLGSVGNLDDLKQCVFDDGVSKACRNICDRCALLLRLLDVGVHKHGTPGAEINRGLRI